MVCVEAVGTNMYLKVCLFMFHDTSLFAGSHWHYQGLVSGDSTYLHMKADVRSLISLRPVSFGGGFDLVMEALGLGHEPSWRGLYPFFIG